MPNIRSSADLRNSYNEISTFCHEYAEPVFITKNGKGDLAVMSKIALTVFGNENRFRIFMAESGNFVIAVAQVCA